MTYSYGPLHIDEQRQDDQLEPTHCSSVPIHDVALKTCRKQWKIEKGGGKGSGISVLMMRHDDDDEDDETKSNKCLHPNQILDKSFLEDFLNNFFFMLKNVRRVSLFEYCIPVFPNRVCTIHLGSFMSNEMANDYHYFK